MPPNIHKHSLSEVPAEELINRSFGIPKEDLIEMGATNALILGDEVDDLVTVLRRLLVVGTPRKILVILTPGLAERRSQKEGLYPLLATFRSGLS